MTQTLVDRLAGVAEGLAVKAPVKAATTGNITLSGAQTIDGVAVAETSPPTRVLVWQQTDATENGIYDVKSAAWTRSADFDGVRDVAEGTRTYTLDDGATLGDREFVLRTSGTVAFGTTELTFESPANIGGLTIDPSTGTLDIADGKTVKVDNTVTVQGDDGGTLDYGGGIDVAAGKTLAVNNSMTLTSNDSATIALGGGLAIAAGKQFALNNNATLQGDDGATVNFGAGINVAPGVRLAVSASVDLTANRTVDHSAVNVVAGNGLTGGGDLTANRTLAVSAGAGIAVGADVTLAAVDSGDLLANLTGGSNAPAPASVSEILDAVVSNARGAIVMRGASGWEALAPGTSGYFLKSQGAGADLSYAAVPGGGDMLSTNNLSELADATTARNNISAALKGQLFGLTLSNNGSDATNDIDIAAGEAASTESSPALMILSSGLTKQLDAAWSVGTNAGGLDTGSIADGTYHVWLIQRSDTGVVDGLFSLSASSPTMPTNYDRKRRIGSIIRASSAIRAFTQRGDHFNLTTPVNDISDATVATGSRTSVTLTGVPAGIVVQAKIAANLENNSAQATFLYFSELTLTDSAPGTSTGFMSLGHGAAASFPVAAEFEIFTDTSRRIGYRGQAASGNIILYGVTKGWVDTRGRLA